MMDMLLQIAIAALPVIMAITLHEMAHGYAALALGDDTAKQMGRLSANPARHIDNVGTLIVPGVLILVQMLTIGRIVFIFGWAKPVPVSAWRFRDPRRGMALVAAAAPLANFILAWLGALAMHGVDSLPEHAGDIVEALLTTFILANLVLGLFNLLPIPPLDGSHVAKHLLPPAWALRYEQLSRFGILILFAFLTFGRPVLATWMAPVGMLNGTLLRVVAPWILPLDLGA